MTKQLTRGPNKGMRNLISASANLTKFRVWYYAAWFTEYILCIDRPTHQVQDVGSVWSTEPEVDSVIIESPTSGPFCRVTIVNMSSNWFRPKWKKKTNVSVTELVFYSSARWIREEKKKVMRNVKLSDCITFLEPRLWGSCWAQRVRWHWHFVVLLRISEKRKSRTKQSTKYIKENGNHPFTHDSMFSLRREAISLTSLITFSGKLYVLMMAYFSPSDQLQEQPVLMFPATLCLSLLRVQYMYLQEVF